MSSTPALRVAELWRFPVKSLQGERLDAATLGPDGIEGDRRWAIFDAETGFGLTGRRHPELLFASARLAADGASPQITLPDGSIAADDAALSAWLGRPVTLRRADEVLGARRYENPKDTERDQDWRAFTGASGVFHDDEACRVSLVSTTTVRGWDRRRFRANVVLDGDGEDALVGTRIRAGDAVLDVSKRIGRCVMVTRPQPDGIDEDRTVLRTIAREREAKLAVGALVVEPGTLEPGVALDRV